MNDQLFFSAVYARLLVRAGVSGLSGLAAQELLAGTSLSVDDLATHEYLAWHDVRQMLVNIEAAGAAPDWPVRFGAQLTLASHGPMGFAALSAPTLADAIGVLAEYHPTRIATLAVGSALEIGSSSPAPPRHFNIVLHELTGDIHYGQQIMEIAVKVMLTLVETIVGHPLMHNVMIKFANPPGEAIHSRSSLLGVDCTYNNKSNEIILPHGWLGIASPLYDERTYRANLIKCREQLVALLAIKRDPAAWVKHQLTGYFENALHGGEQVSSLPDLASSATALNMSSRTLVRRLAVQNSSYKQLLEATRSDYAKNLLQTTHLTVAEIAYVLGYSDAANFIRAFRRWYAVSPAAWRKQNRVRAGVPTAVK